MACPPSSNAKFFGLAVSEFNAKIGWGGESTEVTITLAPTQADIDAGTFGDNLVDLGSPCKLTYEGFVYRGLLHNWEENQSISGLTYSVRLRSPNVVLENTTLVLNGLDENFANCNPNLVVIRDGSQRPKSYCYDFGPRWTEVYNSINKSTTAGNHTLYHKGHQFKVDLTDLADDDVKEYKFDGDTITLMSAIERVAEAAGKRIYVSLKNTGSPSTIEIKAVDIKSVDTKANNIDGSVAGLASGNVQTLISRVDGSASCKSITSYSRGIEAANNVTCAVVNGDNMKNMYTTSNIYQFWGWDGSGNAQMSAGYQGTGDGENFFVSVVDNPLLASFIGQHPTGPAGTYEMNIAEVRAAMEGYESWWSVFCSYAAAGNAQKMGIYTNLGCSGGVTFNLNAITDLANAGDDVSTSYKTMQNVSLGQASKMAEETKEARLDRLKALHQFVAGMSEYYGCKFLVNLTETEVCNNPITINDTQVNDNARKPDLEQTDAGWAPSVHSTAIDDIPAPFKTDDGRVQAIIGFSFSSLPSFIGGTSTIDLGDISGPWVPSDDGNGVYMKVNVEQVMYGSSIVPSAAGVWALVSCPPLKCCPIEYKSEGNPIGLSDSVLSLSNAILTGDEFDAKQGARIQKILNQAGTEDLKGLGVAPGRHNSPATIAIPLKSNRTTYGPRFYPSPTIVRDEYGNIESVSCTGTVEDAGAGRTEYIKDSNLNPWTWGNMSALNYVIKMRLKSMVSKQHVNESGSISFVGFPSALLGSTSSFTLGNVLTSASSSPIGPSITNISVSVGMNGVTTTVQLRTTTRNFGELAQSRIDWMSRVAGAQQRLKRALSERKYEQGAKQRAFAIGASKIKPLSNNSGGTASVTRNYGGSNTGNVMLGQNHGGSDQKEVEGTEARAEAGYEDDVNAKETDVVSGNMTKLVGGLTENTSGPFLSKAGCSMDALWRPFALGAAFDDNEFMAVMTGEGIQSPACAEEDGPKGGGYKKLGPNGEPVLITGFSLNPFMKAQTLEDAGLLEGEDNADHDMRCVVAGNSYEAMDTYPVTQGCDYGNGMIMPAKLITDRTMPTNYRSLGLRGPVVIVGWGYDTEGFPVPNANENYPEEKDCKFLPSFLNSPADWMAGPLDVRWDPNRNVWSAVGGGSGDCPVACPVEPSPNPSENPSKNPSLNPSKNPSLNPSKNPSLNPSKNPSLNPSKNPSLNPSKNPSSSGNYFPSYYPSPSDFRYPDSPSAPSPSLDYGPNPSYCPPVVFEADGYDEYGTQILGHEAGCLKWFNVNDCDTPEEANPSENIEGEEEEGGGEEGGGEE